MVGRRPALRLRRSADLHLQTKEPHRASIACPSISCGISSSLTAQCLGVSSQSWICNRLRSSTIVGRGHCDARAQGIAPRGRLRAFFAGRSSASAGRTRCSLASDRTNLLQDKLPVSLSRRHSINESSDLGGSIVLLISLHQFCES
jgi:hypothetical protein